MNFFKSFQVVAVILLAACSSIKVTSDYDKEVDFSQYTSYSFYQWEQESDKLLTRFDRERIEESVGQELEKRGLKYMEEDGDLTVSLFVMLEQKKGRTAYTNHYGDMGYWDYDVAWGYGMGYSTTQYSEYDYIDGSLVVDIFDTKSRKLVWQGVGSGVVDENPKNRDRKMPAEIAKIFGQFPKAKID